jgi:hypothetical protein
VCAENSGLSYLIANKDSKTDCTVFTLNQNADGSYSIKAKVNSKFVTASNSGFSPLIANQDNNNAYESFYINSLDKPPVFFDWEIYTTDITNSFGDIPDHTIGTPDGHFIMANGKSLNDSSKILSEYLQPTGDTGACLSFYFYFYGG